jgi:hypothetical protein
VNTPTATSSESRTVSALILIGRASVLVFTLVGACGGASATGSAATSSPTTATTTANASAALGNDTDTLIATELVRLRTYVGCPTETSPLRLWCIPLTGWDTATPAEIAPGSHAWVGITVVVSEALTPMQTMRAPGLSALGLQRDGDNVRLRLRAVTPSAGDESESRQIGRAFEAVAHVFESGVGARASIDSGVGGFIASFPGRADLPVTRHGAGWRFGPNGELRRVGDYWIAIERPGSEHGFFLTIFTDRFDVAAATPH